MPSTRPPSLRAGQRKQYRAAHAGFSNMPNFLKKFIPVTTWMVLFCFIGPTLPWGQPEQGAGGASNRQALASGLGQPAASEVILPHPEIKIPSQLATVTEENWNPSASSVVVHIQDAHGHYAAQNQIKHLIDHLQKNHGFSLLLLEGSNVELDPSVYHFFKEPALNIKLADALMKEGELSGAEDR